jgi:hypothetical protein
VTHSLKARIVESQQLAIIRQQHINNRGITFFAKSMLMAAHVTMEYVLPFLSNNCTATEEWCFYAINAKML